MNDCLHILVHWHWRKYYYHFADFCNVHKWYITNVHKWYIKTQYMYYEKMLIGHNHWATFLCPVTNVDMTYRVTLVHPSHFGKVLGLGPYLAKYTWYSNDTSLVEASWVVFHGPMTFSSLWHTFYASLILVMFLV